MVFGCFSGDKESKRHAQSQLKFLEEQNLELANALNEWQALVRQLQQEGESLKSDNAGLGATVEQHEHTIERQASEARNAEAEAVELRQSLDEARAQCHELQMLWEGSANECAQLDSLLAAEQNTVAELQEQIEGYKSDKDYLMEALEKREKALRMAEQVMDACMVDMMQTSKGQGAPSLNWGGEDLDGLGGTDLAGADRTSSDACGLLKGVLGSGLDDGPPKGIDSKGPEAPTSPRAHSSCWDASAAAAGGAEGQDSSMLALQHSRPPRSSQIQVPNAQEDGAGVPSVQRSQSPDMRTMGLRHSIQATKLVLAQSRSSMSSRPSFTPEAKDAQLNSKASSGAVELEGAAASQAATQSRSKAAHSPSRSVRSSGGLDSVAGSKVLRRSSNSSSSDSVQDKQAPGSVRNSIAGGGVGVSGGSKGPAAASKSSSARSSRSTSVRCEAALAGAGAQGADAKQSAELQTPPNGGKSAAARGSANGVLDSLVGSVVYDAMGPSPIQSSVHLNASVASSGMGAFSLQDERSQASQQGGEAQGSSTARSEGHNKVVGSAATTTVRHNNRSVSTSLDDAKQQQLPQAHSQASHPQAAAGSLAHAVAVAMQSPQDSHDKDRHRQQQQQQLGESSSSAGGSVSHSCNSTDRDAALLRFPGSASSRAGSGSSAGGGASLTAAAAAMGGSAGGGQGGEGRMGVRKGPSVRGPTGVLPGGRPSPLKLAAKLDTGKAPRYSGSSGEDVARDADQATKVV